jgi:hemoglobin/transferrin/lactoferrin receptor protein
MSRFTRFTSRRQPLAAAVATAIAVLSAPTWAQQLLQETVVSGSRIEQEIDSVPATLTVITDETIARENPTDLDDLLKHEAGVSVRSQPNRSSGVFRAVGRAGNEGVNIRGLEGDQVRLQVDGVALPMTYSSGPYAAGRGDVIDPEGYKQVEILRGAASTQFGSDGLAGAVSFRTKDPADLLTLGKDVQGNIKLAYASANREWQFAPSAAFKTDSVQGMVLASYRRGHETETMGTNNPHSVNRTSANPSERDADYLLAKLVWSPSAAHQFKLTAESLKRDNATDVYTFFGDPFAAATLTDVEVEEKVTRELVKLDYRYVPQNLWFDLLELSLYTQASENRQLGLERRSANPLLRTRDTRYAEDTLGGSLLLESNLRLGSTEHRVVGGLDLVRNDVTSLKDGYNSSGAAFVANKSFPDTGYRTLGAFLQDEIRLGPVSFTPGVRYDEFKLSPKADALYRVNNTVAPAALKGDELSPRLGAIWSVSPLLQPYAQYAHGFRATKPSQVNGGVTNLTTVTGSGPYTSQGNPDLLPETSDTVELGLRGRDATRRYSVSVFKGKYKDFIASNQLVASNVDLGLGPLVDVFQTVNLSRVTLQGFEARGEWAFAKGWRTSLAYAHVKGDSDDGNTKAPLATVDPDKLVLGLSYEQAGHWGASATATAVERKQRNPDPTTYTAPGYRLLDLSAWYAFSKATRLATTLNNVFDRKYVEWADVRDLAATSTVLDAYTQPGRNFTVSLTHSF